jgi:hypothetical protein
MPSHSDDLSGVLQSWQPRLVEDSGFDRNVWSRIEAAENRRQPALRDFLSFFGWLQQLTRPRVAVTAAMFALFGGILLGGLQARTSQEERYLRSLNPHGARMQQR